MLNNIAHNVNNLSDFYILLHNSNYLFTVFFSISCRHCFKNWSQLFKNGFFFFFKQRFHHFMLVLFLRVCKMVEDGGWEIQFFNFPTRPKKRWTAIKFWIHYLADGVECAAKPIDRLALYSAQQALQSQYSVQWSSSRIFVFLFN